MANLPMPLSRAAARCQQRLHVKGAVGCGAGRSVVFSCNPQHVLAPRLAGSTGKSQGRTVVSHVWQPVEMAWHKNSLADCSSRYGADSLRMV